jgi:hypothetical protein
MNSPVAGPNCALALVSVADSEGREAVRAEAVATYCQQVGIAPEEFDS